jgi:hypothetical protein
VGVLLTIDCCTSVCHTPFATPPFLSYWNAGLLMTVLRLLVGVGDQPPALHKVEKDPPTLPAISENYARSNACESMPTTGQAHQSGGWEYREMGLRLSEWKDSCLKTSSVCESRGGKRVHSWVYASSRSTFVTSHKTTLWYLQREGEGRVSLIQRLREGGNADLKMRQLN